MNISDNFIEKYTFNEYVWVIYFLRVKTTRNKPNWDAFYLTEFNFFTRMIEGFATTCYATAKYDARNIAIVQCKFFAEWSEIDVRATKWVFRITEVGLVIEVSLVRLFEPCYWPFVVSFSKKHVYSHCLVLLFPWTDSRMDLLATKLPSQ